MIRKASPIVSAALVGFLLLPFNAAEPAVPAVGPVTFTVNAVTDVPADFTDDPQFETCRTNVANQTCTLRAAIMNANRHSGSATIILPSGTYTLTLGPVPPYGDMNGDLGISNTVTIAGAGAAGTVVDAGGIDRLFYIYPSGTLTMTGVTLRGGHSLPYDGGQGGALYNLGHISVANSVLRDNQSFDAGGAVWNRGTATLTRDTLEANTSSADGGAIYNAGSGVATLSASTVDLNHSQHQGGGLYNLGSLTLFNSTLSNNSAGLDGGGVWNYGNIDFFHTTVAGNLADEKASGSADGGGLHNDVTGVARLWNSLFQDNFTGSTAADCDGHAIISMDYNLIESPGTCASGGSAAHDEISVSDENLGPLADNGGPTRTRALLTGSAALDHIPAGLCRDPFGTAPVPDQRGVARPMNSLCDMGAFEGQLTIPALGANLVRNGDAEASPGSPTGQQVGTLNWSNDGPFTQVPYGAPGGFPSASTDSVPSSHGVNFFSGGNSTPSTGQQIVSLVPIGSLVDAGAVQFVLSGDLGGYASERDNATVSLLFVDNGAHHVGPVVTLGPVTPAQRGNQTRLLHVSRTGVVPPHVRYVFVTITLTALDGSFNDGYADNISLVLHASLFLPLIVR